MSEIPGESVDTRDAELIDDLVESAAEPPPRSEWPVSKTENSPIQAEYSPFKNLVTASADVLAVWPPHRIINADNSRKEVHIYCASDTATDYVIFADSDSKMNSLGARCYAGQEIVLDNYAGPIWVKVVGTGPVSVNVVAVTK